MTRRSRRNGEGSIFPYRNGCAAYVWVTTPAWKRQRKYVYGKTREEVHEKWIKLQGEARRGTGRDVGANARLPRLLAHEVVEPNVAPLTAATYGRWSGSTSRRGWDRSGSIGGTPA